MGCQKKLNTKEKGELVALLEKSKAKHAKGEDLCKQARERLLYLNSRFEKYGSV